jgi:hypothetical protein
MIMKLTDILREIGEASSAPYDYKYSGDLYEAYFTTDKGTPYKVNFGIDEYGEMEISFGTVDERDNMNYEIDTNEGNLFRVMSTVMKIINQAIAQFKPSIISFGATKSDPRRMNMYRKYVVNNIKGYSIAHDKDSFLTLQRDTLKDKLKKTFKITENGMKLTDILREIEGDEDGMKQMKVNYDLAVEPADLDKALAALNDTKNYGIYAQNMSDRKTLERVFGPSIPSQKAQAAWKDWDSRSEDEKAFKLIDIKNRVPEAWEATQKETELAYEKWQAEGNDGSINDYLFSLPGKSLPKSLIGTYGKFYYPEKNSENTKKYGGKMEQDVHYVVEDGKIIFPSTLENPYKTKPYLSKVLKTIMDNAGVDFKLVDVEQDGGETPTTREKTPPPTNTPSVLTLTLDPDKIKGKKPELNAMVKLLQNTYDKNFDYDKENNVIKITNIKPERRNDVRSQFAKFLKTPTPVKENFDFERYQMLRRAGIIK